MRFKPDENLPVELADLFRAAGHDAATALDQYLWEARDSYLASVCRREGRAIVPLDTYLADIRTCLPEQGSADGCHRPLSPTRCR